MILVEIKKSLIQKMSLLQAKADWKQSEIGFLNQVQSIEIKLNELYQKYNLYLENTKSNLNQQKAKREERKFGLISEIEYLKSEEEVFVSLESVLEPYFQYISTALELVLLLGENPFDNRYYQVESKRTPSDLSKVLDAWKEMPQDEKINEPIQKKYYPLLMEDPYETR